MLTGWGDLFLPWMLRDYAVLVAAGNAPELTIGPWSHSSTGHGRAIPPGDDHLPCASACWGDPPSRRQPVRIFVTGDGGGWRDLPAWPPPTCEQQWQLSADGLLRADPRPGAGRRGPNSVQLRPGRSDPVPRGTDTRGPPGHHQQRRTRAATRRPDLHQRRALPNPSRSPGPSWSGIDVTADNGHHDLFVRLCDVDEQGRSWDVCDGDPAHPRTAGRDARRGRPQDGLPGTLALRPPVHPGASAPPAGERRVPSPLRAKPRHRGAAGPPSRSDANDHGHRPPLRQPPLPACHGLSDPSRAGRGGVIAAPARSALDGRFLGRGPLALVLQSSAHGSPGSSASASARPTQVAPSTDLPGSRSL